MTQKITKEMRDLLDSEAEAGTLTKAKLVDILGEFVLDEVKNLGILERLIVATGVKDERVNSNITSSNFKITEEPDDRELVLVHPNKWATTKEVHAFMAEQGIQPEGPDYLARHAKDPELGLEFPVVALDPNKLWRDPHGDLYCVVLWSSGGVRGFNLLWIDGHWLGHFRFVGSRKLKP